MHAAIYYQVSIWLPPSCSRPCTTLYTGVRHCGIAVQLGVLTVPACFHVLSGIGAGDGQDLFLHIIADGTTTADFALYNPAVSSKVLADAGGDVLTVDIKHGAVPPIKGNVKFRFTCSTKIKMKGLYDKSLFFFWLHTGFVKDFRFHLTRDDIDNPHKPKTHGVFRDNFAVELIFEEV
eukprot:scpid92919/ scgid3658/ Phosphatidylinositol 3,4,5-trisphosphate 3-phosphatase TPTE2; Lipid phosphatase TPIP; TPTE and PTEN homologous inositol lipid phosphatase